MRLLKSFYQGKQTPASLAKGDTGGPSLRRRTPPSRGPHPRRRPSPPAVRREVAMTVAAGLFVPSPSVWWARGDGASSLRATAAAATTPSSTEVADPTPWRVDPAAPMPDLRWWASWPCGAALAAMVVLGCAAHPWRCDGLTVVSVAVGGVACARGWCGGALARRWW